MGLFVTLLAFGLILGFVALCVAVSNKAEKEEKMKKEEAERKEKERLENLTPEEKKREAEERNEKLLAYQREHLSLPYRCPSCFEINYELALGCTYVSKWILDSTETVKEEKFDHASTFMGTGTIYTKTSQREIQTYRCPHCGYKHKK